MRLSLEPGKQSASFPFQNEKWLKHKDQKMKISTCITIPSISDAIDYPPQEQPTPTHTAEPASSKGSQKSSKTWR